MSRLRWHRPGRAIAAAAAVSAVVAVAGCAAGAKIDAGPSGGPTQHAANAAAATTVPVPVPAAKPAAKGDPNGILLPAPTPPAPRCPPLVHYAAGNAGPLFCTDGRDDPAALRYFMTLHLKVMGLAASASQPQAVGAICADLLHTAVGTEYSAYLLAATREHWYFVGIAKVHGALSRLCPK
jgi:outer membrane murein-binding lipoprotein Lpp